MGSQNGDEWSPGGYPGAVFRRLTLFLFLTVAACDCGGDDDDTLGRACTSSTECPDGQTCIDSMCTARTSPDGRLTDMNLKIAMYQQSGTYL